MNTTQFCEEARRLLQPDGYEVQRGQPEDGADLAGACWFTWMRPGMASAVVGPTVADEREAWASALAHRLDSSAIALHPHQMPLPSMGPFEAARLPDDAFDPSVLAARFGIDAEAAREQAAMLRRQSVHVNERYQVNVQRIPAPFGPGTSDMLWLSIKRRDREPIHDRRDLQRIKNAIVARNTRASRSGRVAAGGHGQPVSSVGLRRPEGAAAGRVSHARGDGCAGCGGAGGHAAAPGCHATSRARCQG